VKPHTLETADPYGTELPARGEQPRVRPVAPAASPVDTDALLDELSDRLAQAAAELGVPEV
jgi:hypothetical protein